MAVAAEDLAAGAAASATRSRPARQPYVPLVAPARGQQHTGAGILIRLVWAFALGLIVLEVLSQSTGRYFNWDLKRGWQNLRAAGTYVGLYPGQPAPAAAPTNTGAGQYPYAAASSLQTATQPGIVNQPSTGSIVSSQGANAPGFRP